MNILKLKTNLRCNACVNAIKPLLDATHGVSKWSADVTNPDKTLTVEGENITRKQIDDLLHQKGYEVLEELPVTPTEMKPEAALPQTSTPMVLPPADEPKSSYFPLLLILAYILGVTAFVEGASGLFDWMRAMGHFMAGFFLVFSFFKILNLTAFVDAYAGYDIVAAKWRFYGYVYPFIELALGAAYLTGFQPLLTNILTILVMGVSTIGVVKSLLARRKIRCACLGAVFNLPMSYVTLTEDLLMVLMALAMLSYGFVSPHHFS